MTHEDPKSERRTLSDGVVLGAYIATTGVHAPLSLVPAVLESPVISLGGKLEPDVCVDSLLKRHVLM